MAASSARSRRLAEVERRIRVLVEAAPPLTQEQRDRLVMLLRPATGDAA